MPFDVKAQGQDQSWSLRVSLPGPSLLEILQQNEVPIRSSCMGKGLCHQCRVRVLSGLAAMAAMDKKAFSSEQLRQGWRLSCGLRPRSKIEVLIPQIYHFQEDLQVLRPPQSPWSVVLDLGTTGLEFIAWDEQGEWARLKALNRQVSMGADVMTRLEYAQKNGVASLQKKIQQQTKKLVNRLEESGSKKQPFQRKIWVAGNSAVTSFLLGESTEQLAVSPYQPHFFASQKFQLDDWEVETLPLLYSFVGGDLWAGLFFLWKKGLVDQGNRWVLIDVGTNSEILCWDGTHLFISSTPAGPAFEGSSISIGMRAEAGAIVSPNYSESTQSWSFEVIGADQPRGLCGSSLVDVVAQAVRFRLVSRDGELLDEKALALTEDLRLQQGDIREFQLAKSAIRTGLDLVIREGEVAPQKLFLAGAFGAHLHLDSCVQLGLFPAMEIEVLGNTSLQGALQWAQASLSDKTNFTNWVQQVKKPIELALRDEFQQAFIENMVLG